MKTISMTFILIFLTSATVLAQESSADTTSGKKDSAKPEKQEAYYPEGNRALYMYLFRNLRYSEQAKEDTVRGELEVSFFVDPDSTVSDVRVLNPKDVPCGCHEQIPDLLKDKKFIPALEQGQPVRSTMYIKIPIKVQ